MNLLRRPANSGVQSDDSNYCADTFSRYTSTIADTDNDALGAVIRTVMGYIKVIEIDGEAYTYTSLMTSPVIRKMEAHTFAVNSYNKK